MHSSRMRTGRSLTVCRSLLLRGGGSPWQGGLLGRVLLGRGVSLVGGGLLGRGVSLAWGLLGRRGSPWQGGIPACSEADHPLVNRMTDRCKNITLATTSLRPVKKRNEKQGRIQDFPGDAPIYYSAKLSRKRMKMKKIGPKGRGRGKARVQNADLPLEKEIKRQITKES